MKYAFDNANLIDGTQDMRVQPGLCVLTDGETITDIPPAPHRTATDASTCTGATCCRV